MQGLESLSLCFLIFKTENRSPVVSEVGEGPSHLCFTACYGHISRWGVIDRIALPPLERKEIRGVRVCEQRSCLCFLK